MIYSVLGTSMWGDLASSWLVANKSIARVPEKGLCVRSEGITKGLRGSRLSSVEGIRKLEGSKEGRKRKALLSR